MNHLESLASLLSQDDRVAQALEPLKDEPGASGEPAPGVDMDQVIATLRQQARSAGETHAPLELQSQAVHRFWQAQRLDTLKDARLVSFGICLLHEPDGHSIIEDSERLSSLLNGVDQWLNEPRWFRRCYQGLLRSYFAYDAKAADVRSVARQNWERLRQYLLDRVQKVVDQDTNPDWVKTIISAPHLFADTPCMPYAAATLQGDNRAVDLLCAQLGVPPESWFLRELVLAQVKASTGLSGEAFVAMLPTMLERLGAIRVLRDAGLALLINHYATLVQADVHAGLRDTAVRWWGNPLLAVNQTRWSGAVEPARAMIAEWVKLDLIEIFFAKFTDGSAMEWRRCDFWKRYIKSIDTVRFALGTPAPKIDSELAPKLEGLTTQASQHALSNAALVMTIGPAVLVELSSYTEAACAYDARKSAPFSLALVAAHPIVRMQHDDGVQGWRKWEDMFEATLLQQFDIRTGATLSGKRDRFVDLSDIAIELPSQTATVQSIPSQIVGRSPGSLREDFHWQTAEAASVPFSRADLEIFARVHSLQLEDTTMQGGSLWIRAADTDPRINRVLSRWGFAHETGSGWRRVDRKTRPSPATRS
jgi:EH_Signature domain